MDAVTHVLAGACIARTGLNHKTALATLTFMLAAEDPDLDVLARLKGPVPGFIHDRGFTHSGLPWSRWLWSVDICADFD